MNLHDEIAAVAYEMFETRGRIGGRDLDDWLDAEKIVLARHAGQEIEEPEEEDFAQEMAVAGVRTSGADAGIEENGGPYYEEMS